MKAKKIKYKHFNETMIKTRCEFKPCDHYLDIVYLNTLCCINCDYYQGTNPIKKYVICSHPNNFNEN